MDLQSAIDSLPVDSQVLCGSVSTLMYQTGSLGVEELDTTDTVDVDKDTQSTGYSQVQLATALQWDERQRKMMLLEQILTRNDVGKHSSCEMWLYSGYHLRLRQLYWSCVLLRLCEIVSRHCRLSYWHYVSADIVGRQVVPYFWLILAVGPPFWPTLLSKSQLTLLVVSPCHLMSADNDGSCSMAVSGVVSSEISGNLFESFWKCPEIC